MRRSLYTASRAHLSPAYRISSSQAIQTQRDRGLAEAGVVYCVCALKRRHTRTL
uniref:Uncharacterized protein n=1 Tax=Mesocestoides corti TaxID=53468 RepID=A0A5K3F4M8_MESCO